jgi:RHS repeat-associated protein
LTDATGALKASYAYDPWGKLTTPIDPLGTKNKYKFTEQSLDPGTGLYFLRARYYDPGAGRFVARDPAQGSANLPQSFNKYQYALNNPVRFVDLRGLSAVDAEASADSTLPISSSGSTSLIGVIGGVCEVVGYLLDTPGELVQDLLINLGDEFVVSAGSSEPAKSVPCASLLPYGFGGLFSYHSAR